MTLILVAGALANKAHNGGEAWVRLSWLLGLRRLGFEVFFLEQLAEATCVDAAGAPCPFDECEGLRYFDAVTAQFNIQDSCALIDDTGRQVHGACCEDLGELAGSADLLLNISGHLRLPHLLDRIRHKVFVDIDPGFTQFWHVAAEPAAALHGHDEYFTIGENIGTPRCSIPSGGVRWRSVRQPVVLDHWPVSPAIDPARFTTVASWRGPYGPIMHEGRLLGVKAHEFRKVAELPARAAGTFEIALDIHPADGKDRELLLNHGWRLVDPRVAAGDPDKFRRYVQESGAEFSVAQGVYVDTYSGWFSDRTVRYLAAGKPVLVQDTGQAQNLPVGEGLIVFRTLDDAVTGARRILQDYQHHAAAARRLAETHFSSDVVLGRLVDQLGIAP